MRKTVVLAVACALITELPASAAGQTTPAQTPAKPPSTCEVLSRDWKAVEFELADNYVQGITDDSAPRATMRAARNTEALAQAELTLSLMREFKCTLPKRAPSEMTYSLSAMTCRTEMLKGNYKAPQCDRATWTPLFSEQAPITK